ncbi:DNA cytosine methyltransferase [Streptomyces syringium]|uniref:DNA cytosine methyltransferase n=1 Tax=Streptomyces syringium TaxID=76729 RepID=UPI003D8C282B
MTTTDAPTSIHLFAGGCGDLLGFKEAGFRPLLGANHAPPAVATLRANFPGVRGVLENIHLLSMGRLPEAQCLTGSPICKESSPAGGRTAPKAQMTLDDAQDANDEDVPSDWSLTRATAWDLLRGAEAAKDRGRPFEVIAGENVPGFGLSWLLFNTWVRGYYDLGYVPYLASVDAAHIDAGDLGSAPQHRNRMLFAFVRKGLPAPDLRPRPLANCTFCGPVRGIQRWAKARQRKVGTYGTSYIYVCPHRKCGHLPVEPVTRPIGDCIDFSLPTRRVGDGRAGKVFRPYVDETRRKIDLGRAMYGDKPFIAIMRRNCVAQSLDEPIGTITAEGNHHMLVIPGDSLDNCRIRMLSIKEKARAQRFPDHHRFQGTDTEKTRLIGNAVPVNVGTWLGQRVAAVL